MYLLLNVGWLFSEHSLYIRLTLGRFFYTAQSLLLKYKLKYLVNIHKNTK